MVDSSPRMSWTRCVLWTAAGCWYAAALGCGGQTLPVRHVAIYRNGVAYLERAGRVDAHEVRFRMKESEIGDFLATLAVTERGGSSVRTAAFPIDPAAKDEDKNDARTVVLSLDGAAHDLQVGYIAQAPVWKPSYRLVMGEADAAEFQIWGLVQNVSGEDWRDVRLSLVGGAPVAFSTQMQTPVIPSRPTVVDRGESFDAVPASETTSMHALSNQLTQSAAGRAGRTASPAQSFHSKADSRDLLTNDAQSVLPAGSGEAPPAAATAPSPEFFGGSTRYDLALPVTILNESTSMVMIGSRHVKGEEIFLFAPNGGIPASASHPFRAVRFVNDTGGELETGPIALFGRGMFLGQALLESVPIGASATLPFALDRAIAVEVDTKTEGAPSSRDLVARIANGQLSITTTHGFRTIYRLHNGGEKAAKVFVKHPLGAGSKLFAPPPGAEERVGAGTALVPADVRAHETKQLVVDEQSEEIRVADWFGEAASYAVRTFLADPRSDSSAVQRLSSAWPLREEAVAKMREREHLRQQRYDLQQEAEDVRRNLAVVGGGTGDELRARLGARLAQAVARIADQDKKIVGLDADIARASEAFKSLVGDIRTER